MPSRFICSALSYLMKTVKVPEEVARSKEDSARQ